MAPRWAASSDKHGVARTDQIHAILHANYIAELPGQSVDDGSVWLYIGPEHPHTAREVELLVNIYPDARESVIFHAMRLGPKFRRYREEHPYA